MQAKANRGILYVDEVNLLDDGLVDVVLDSAASGINTVEREGISIQHPAKFIMIGSGNPSEVWRPCAVGLRGKELNATPMTSPGFPMWVRVNAGGKGEDLGPCTAVYLGHVYALLVR